MEIDRHEALRTTPAGAQVLPAPGIATVEDGPMSCWVEAGGEIDAFSGFSRELALLLADQRLHGRWEVVGFDLRRVTFIDSAALCALAGTLAELDALGVTVLPVLASAPVARLAEICGLVEAIQIVEPPGV